MKRLLGLPLLFWAAAPVEVKWDEKPVTDGRATVRCTYQGKVKIYQIN